MRRRYPARLAPCVAFPFAPLAAPLFFQRGETCHQRAAVAVWAQAHIHTKYIAIGSEFVDEADQAAAQPGKKFMVAQFAWAIGFAVFGLDKNQIDIG